MLVLALIGSLMVILGKLATAAAAGDIAGEENALMEAQELLKAEWDRRKFSKADTDPPRTPNNLGGG